jgi:AcrR family transcriptional regulator
MSDETAKSPASVIWMRPVRGSRGPEPSRNRDAIAQTAIAIADREGIAAVSMRRIAAEIGSGTSSLYRYFARKDDLLNLMVDGALVATPFVSSGDWRADLTAMGHALRELFQGHPWLGIALAGRPTLGPNRLRALETALQVLEPTGLPVAERLLVVDALTSYVRGFVASEVADVAAIRESGLSEAQWRADQLAYNAYITGSGLYPRTAEMFETFATAVPEALQDGGFAAGLEIVIDGIAVRLGRLPRRT